jgi:hypothetical protein
MAIHPQREHAIRRCLEQGEPPPKVGAELGVDLSKPRLPAVVIGLLYKLLWGAAVLVDIDDEELCNACEREPITLDGLKRRWIWPSGLTGSRWPTGRCRSAMAAREDSG